MRTTILLLTVTLLSFSSFAQEGKEINVDSMLVNIDKPTFNFWMFCRNGLLGNMIPIIFK
ncbi:MAG: hypothetical protein WBA61_03170 [Aequorivita sp.]